MTVFRITLKQFASKLSASGIAGRWNSEGNKVIYTAGSISLAILENMIRRKGYGFNRDFCILLIHIPNALHIKRLEANNIPQGWNTPNNYATSQPIGDSWYMAHKTAILQVPSALLPQEYNYVLNTFHPDFKKIALIETLPFVPDSRIEDILKKHKVDE